MSVEIEWRTVQFFISPDVGVCEVSVDVLNPKRMRCSCPQFANKARCRHVNFIKDKMKANEGVFPVRVPEDVTEEEVEDAFADTEAFREFVIKYGKPEIL